MAAPKAAQKLDHPPSALPIRPRVPVAAGAATPAPVSLDGVAALLQDLNPEQKRAVTHGEGPLLVVAGPGTGKTRVVTRRIAWLVATKRARPSEILALTFTDKAAAEMESRVDALVPYGYADTAIHTFHAFGDRLLREFAFELGLPNDPRVLSRAETVIFLREHLFELGLERYRPLADPTRFLGALAALFGRAKDEDVTPEEFLGYAEALQRAATAPLAGSSEADVAALLAEAAGQRELAVAYGSYVSLLRAAACIDFGDQVGLALRLLREHPAVRADVEARFRYILVDEFQDTNPAQLELLALLAGSRPNVTVVGDDDQSIYTFRGAALSNVLGFPARFTGTRQIVLRRNYRSRPAVLDAAYRLIRHNDPCRLEARAEIDKRLVPARPSRRRAAVEVRAFPSLADEADWVAETIAERVTRGARPGDFAVLVRSNGEADRFLRSLNMRSLPWHFSGGSGLYSRPDVRDLLAFLRAVSNLDSTVDLYAVATAEPYGLGGPDLTAVLEYARRRHRSLWAVLVELDAQPGVLRLSDATRQAARRLVADLTWASEAAHRRPAGEVLYGFLKRTGRLARLAAAGTAEADEALANISRFFEVVRGQERVLPDARVHFLVDHLRTLIDAGAEPAADEPVEDCHGVSVLTVHKANGLEFPVVFLVGLVDGRFPARGRREPLALPDALCRDRRVPDTQDEAPYAEERRLCYVAMTRAREELVLSYAEEPAAGRPRRASPFIAEALDAPLPRVARRDSPVAAADAIESLLAGDAAQRVPPPATGTPGSRLSLSFSQLDDYLSCPLKYRLRHMLRVPVPAHHALVYGSALHQAVAAFHVRQAKGKPMTEEELLGVFREHWSSEGFLSREHEEARFAAGEAALRRFRDAQISAAAPAAVEKEFAFGIDGDRIRGRFDRVDEEPEGTVITDYKSSDVRDPARARQKARESLQLAIYALAHEAQTGTPPAAVQLYFLESGVVGRAPVDPRRLAAAREKVRGAADAIRRGDFAARPDYVNCSYCPFRDICPSSAA